jgi:hypothetical protein
MRAAKLFSSRHALTFVADVGLRVLNGGDRGGGSRFESVFLGILRAAAPTIRHSQEVDTYDD